jgi:hypothetical protein
LGAHRAHRGPGAHPFVAARHSSASQLRRLAAARSRTGSLRLAHTPACPCAVCTARSRSASVA